MAVLSDIILQAVAALLKVYGQNSDSTKTARSGFQKLMNFFYSKKIIYWAKLMYNLFW